MATTVLILALAAGTFAIRAVPLSLLSRLRLPDWALDWLGFVPGAVLAASLAQTLVAKDGGLALMWTSPYLWAALPTFLIAWRTRSVILTMASGMAAYVAATHIIG